MDKPNVRKAFLGGMYALLMAAGFFGLFVPTPSLAKALGLITYGWAIFLIVGGLCGLIACITDRWLPELAGLPLLVSALTVYGFALFLVPPFTAVKATIGALMLSSAAGLVVRLKEPLAFASANVGEAD
jgi:hypothetical protein